MSDLSASSDLEVFLAAPPGLEPELAVEAAEAGFAPAKPVPGGVILRGGWSDVWRANLLIRGASRVLVRIAEFPAVHLSQLDKRARRIPWLETLERGTPFKVEAVCRKSKIYHARAATQRVEQAVSDALGSRPGDEDAVRILVRIDHNLCTISLDTSGELLHRRGFKPAVSKAPIRENLAALFLRASGYTGEEAVLDPMCGSGTFVIEAAEIARGLAPGRERDFAFERFKGFGVEAWASLRAGVELRETRARFFGADRDAGAIRASEANAARAGVDAITHFQHCPVADLEAPDIEPGLIMINPPYGGRIGNKRALFNVYDALGITLRTRFKGWRVGLVTTDPALAKATRLPFSKPGPFVEHGGLKIRLWNTKALG